MTVLSTMKKYAWVPYLLLAVGLLALFANQEMKMLSLSANEIVDLQKETLLPQSFIQPRSRRDVDLNDYGNVEKAYYSDQLGKLKYSDVLEKLLEKIKQESLPEELIPVPVDEEVKPADTNNLVEMAAPVEFHNPQIVPDFEPDVESETVPEAEQSVVSETEVAEEKMETSNDSAQNNAENPEIVLPVNYEQLHASMPPLGSEPTNRRFVFHNKIPKAGSTTMKWLLVALSKRNGFTLDHARWCLTEKDSEHPKESCNAKNPETGAAIDGPDGEDALADYIPKQRAAASTENYFLIKHHHWFNFTDKAMEKPTYINVARDPVTRYSSWYYFERFGWARHEGTRARFFGDEEAKYRTLDECVAGDHEDCKEPHQVLAKYFCGTDSKKCGMMSSSGLDLEKVAAVTERAKKNIAQEFFVVGVLERFSETLQLFEKMLPEYYAGAPEISRTPEILRQRESTKSSNAGFNNATRHALETGVLRYEVDIYNLIKALFAEKLRFYNL